MTWFFFVTSCFALGGWIFSIYMERKTQKIADDLLVIAESALKRGELLFKMIESIPSSIWGIVLAKNPQLLEELKENSSTRLLRAFEEDENDEESAHAR